MGWFTILNASEKAFEERLSTCVKHRKVLVARIVATRTPPVPNVFDATAALDELHAMCSMRSGLEEASGRLSIAKIDLGAYRKNVSEPDELGAKYIYDDDDTTVVVEKYTSRTYRKKRPRVVDMKTYVTT